MVGTAAPIDLSIIIPTYNRGTLLGHTLRSLTGLQIPRGVQVETIVCDDGSADDTFAIVKQFERMLTLRYCYQPDTGHRVAAARNMGIALARGRIVLFLDCGVLTAPTLVKEHLVTHACSDRGSFVIGPMWGYHTDDPSALAEFSSNSDHWVDRVLRHELPADPRTEVWEAVGFRLDRLSAPWSIGWGTNISMPREALLAIGGFDEAFEGWGGEDVDLAYRLYSYGLTFVANPDAMTLHLPHADDSDHADVTNYHNKKLIFAKAPGLETELLPAFGTRLYSQRLDEIRAVARRALIPDYAASTDPAFHDWLKCTAERPVAVIGAGSGEICELVRCAWAADPDAANTERIRRSYPWIETACRMGVNTGLPDGAFGSVILTDFWRAWQPRVVRELLLEACRIGRQPLLLYSPDYDVGRVAAAPAWDLAQLTAISAELELDLTPLYEAGPATVYMIGRRVPGADSSTGPGKEA